MNKLNNYKYVEIESFRAILAWWVVFSHVLGTAGFNYSNLVYPFNVLRNGSLAVNGFMIVSGFVIAHLIVTKKEAYIPYITRRFLRLFPLFMFVSLASVFIYKTLGVKSSSASYDTWGINLLLNATMLHGMIPDQVMKDASRALINPGWSISLEWQFYLLAPLFFLKSKRGIMFLLLIAFSFLVTGGYLNRKSLDLNYPHASLLIFSIHYFMIGIFSYYLHEHLKNISLKIGIIESLLLTFLIFAVTRDYAISIWCLFFSIFLIGKCDTKSKFMTSKYLVSLGRVSYSTYLIHYVVISVLALELRGYFQKSSYELLISLMITTIVITVPVSFLLYKYVELPFIKLGKNYFKELEKRKLSNVNK
ncbi:acyltransferase family protein [Pseudoalteromonas spongiae]|uniref:acyltransferase family protein n=1 Tax=Pseudoalteromonas spongiae TaxID=298657 RepID=UPI0012FE3683|nr:acyltransferase [Pseudoalteromonas spongiae]